MISISHIEVHFTILFCAIYLHHLVSVRNIATPLFKEWFFEFDGNYANFPLIKLIQTQSRYNL